MPGFFGAAMAVVAVVPITIAGLVAISRIGRRSITRINVDHRIVASIVFELRSSCSCRRRRARRTSSRGRGVGDQVDKARLLALEDVGPVVALTVSPQLSAEVAERQTLYETPLGPPSVGIIWRPTTPIVLIDTTAEGRTGSPSGTTTTGELLGSLLGQGYQKDFDSNGIYRLVQ